MKMPPVTKPVHTHTGYTAHNMGVLVVLAEVSESKLTRTRGHSWCNFSIISIVHWDAQKVQTPTMRCTRIKLSLYFLLPAWS